MYDIVIVGGGPAGATLARLLGNRYSVALLEKRVLCMGGQRVALVGEAAGFISPSSAEGFSYAFKSALALAKALENDIDGFQESYRKNLNSLIMNIRVKNLKSPAMYNAFLRKIIMGTGIMSVDIVE